MTNISKDGYDRVEHDGVVNAKNVSIVKSTATVYAVVNTAAVAAGNTTVEQGTTPWVTSLKGNVTIEDGGVALTVDGSGVTQPVSGTFWQTTQPVSFSGNVTIEDGGVALSVTESSPISGFATEAKQLADGHNVAIKGNVTVDQVDVVTTVTAVTDITNPIALKGNITIDSGNIAVTSSPTIYAVVNTSAGGGNVTVEQGTDPWVIDGSGVTQPVSFAGNITIDSGTVSVDSNMAWSDPNTYLGLVTVDIGASKAVSFAGNVTLDDGSLTGLVAGEAYVGLATIDIGSAPTLVVDATGQGDVPITLDGEVVATTFSGNITIDSGNIAVTSSPTIYAVVNTSAGGGNVTVEQGTSPWVTSFAGNVTIDSGVITSVTDITNPIALKGNLTIDSGTVSVDSNTAWADPNTYLGLATIDIGSAPTLIVDATGQGDVPITLDGEAVATTFSGNITIDSGVITTVAAVTDITNPIATKGNVTIDSGVITTVTAVTDITNPIALKGNVTIEDGGVALTVDGSGVTQPVSFSGNVTLDDGSLVGLLAGSNNIGDVDIASGTVDVVTTITNPVATKGNVTIDSGVITTVTAVTDVTNPIATKGNVTIDSGVITTVTALTDITNPIALKGNLTIDSIQGYSVAYTSGPTTDWIVKAAAGHLHAIQFGAAVGSSIVEISDHASDGDGAVEFYYSGGTLGPAIYPINATMGTGITLDVTNQTHVTVLFR